MTTSKTFICEECESEFYVETQDTVEYCVSCGEVLVDEDLDCSKYDLYDPDEE